MGQECQDCSCRWSCGFDESKQGCFVDNRHRRRIAPAAHSRAAASPLSSAGTERVTHHASAVKPSPLHLKCEFLPCQRLAAALAPVPALDQHALAVEILVSALSSRDGGSTLNESSSHHVVHLIHPMRLVPSAKIHIPNNTVPKAAATHCVLSLHVAAAVAARCCLWMRPPPPSFCA